MQDIIRHYRAQLQHKGRNDALFAAICLARDFGFIEGESVFYTGGLYDEFIRTPAPPGHKHETERQRGKEFDRTLESVYTRSPRPVKSDAGISAISDNARQNLHKAGLGNAARVIDALFAVGFQPGQVFTQGEAVESLKGIVYQNGVRDALESVLPNGKLLFFRPGARPSPRAPHPGDAVAGMPQQNMRLVHRKKPKKTISGTSGRPAKRYIMPDLDTIQRLTEAEYKSSTPLRLQHIANPKKYRSTLVAGLLKRRPGTYAQDSLGDWYGVTGRTIRTYLKTMNGLKVIRQSQYIQDIGWDNVDALLSDFNDEIDKSFFLEDKAGRKYPPVKGAAIMALSKHRELTLRRRRPNFYAFGAIAVPKTDSEKRAQRLEVEQNQEARREKQRNRTLEENSINYWKDIYETPRSSRPEATQDTQNGHRPDYLADDAFLDFAAKLNVMCDYWQENTLDGLQGFSEATMRHLERNAHRKRHEDAVEAAKTACALINGVVTEERLKLGFKPAIALALEFSGEELKQAAVKIATEYQMQRGEAAKMQQTDPDKLIKNPAGLLTYRLRRRADCGETE
jgi:hypothetical protein